MREGSARLSPRFAGLALAALAVFFLLRLPSLVEPSWYADEGTYADVGQALDRGAVLYRDVWDNKPPGIYWLAGAVTEGGASAFALHLALAVLVGLSTTLVWWMGRRLAGTGVAWLAAAVFAVLASLPNLDGDILNAEIAATPLVLAALLLVLSAEGGQGKARMRLLAAGGLVGAALLFKAVFVADLAAVVTVPAWLVLARGHRPGAGALRAALTLLGGAAAMLALAALVLALGGSLGGLVDVLIHQDVTYVRWANGVGATTTSGALAGAQTESLLGALAASRLLVAVALGAAAAWWAARRGRAGAAVISWWLGCDLATVMMSARGFTHYLQQAEPALALAAAMLGVAAVRRFGKPGWAAAGGVLAATFVLCELVLWVPRAEVALALGSRLPAPELHNFRAQELPEYYLRTWQRLTGAISQEQYASGFPGHVGRKLAIVQLFQRHSRPEQTVFVWGAVPWVYSLSDRAPAGRFVTLNSAYYLDPNAEANLLSDLSRHPPAVLVVDHPPPGSLWTLLHGLHYRVVPHGVVGDDYWLAPWAP